MTWECELEATRNSTTWREEKLVGVVTANMDG